MMLSKFQEELKTAMKSGDKKRITAIRNIFGKLKARKIDKGEELTDDESMKIIQSSVKQLKDSIEQYKNAGRDDLAEAESYELSFLEQYLPKQMGEDELKVIVKKIIGETGASSQADIGKVMGPLMKDIAGKADGKMAQQIVRELLS
ncbi:MAG: GatB/YqeY domain-containing protein [Candidatus Marinimicrobia bacterium]|nr:GatB/YqeY domain-containing protein [Candidatus Neomarinimicrobiota bacterium]MBL7022897.1 GatB/YqeY domain-containing protein [Candidatus Neomarinimicrobiota bacterium]MBL7109216.1 GatB/YqeY domain-containing protein [Candidatus Neomarinimicrobiota bacterium]